MCEGLNNREVYSLEVSNVSDIRVIKAPEMVGIKVDEHKYICKLV